MSSRTARCQVSGIKYQETREDEMKLILSFLTPDTCHLPPDTCYLIRSAKSPNSGNSKRSPRHALSDRTIHKNNMASETRSPNRRKSMAAATFERKRAAMVKTKKTPQSKILCQA